MATKRISKIHQKHSEWIKKLNFIRDEIISLFDELDYAKSQMLSTTESKEFGAFKALLQGEWQKAENFIGLIRLNENYLAFRAQRGQHIAIDPDPITENIQLFFLDFISVKEEIRNYIIENLRQRKVSAT